MGTKIDYPKKEIEICLSVLIELMTILGQFRDNIVLIGGWVPYFLLGEKGTEHIGSTDIDLAIDFKHIPPNSYRTILELMKKHHFKQGKQPYIFLREIIKDDITYTIEIDFLAGEYGGSNKSHRTQKFQDIRIRKARGCDLSFEHNTKRGFSFPMPDGSQNEIELRVSEVMPFLVMKGMALYERYKEKDAYDIYFIISEYPGGIEALVDTFKPYINNKLVLEGLSKIKSKFKEINSPGPVWLVNFLEITDEEIRAMKQRDAFERINAFLDACGISEFQPNDS